MATGVYTERLFGGQIPAVRNIVPVPGDRRWVIRDIVAMSTTQCRIDVSVFGAGYVWVAELAAAGTAWYAHWTGRQVVRGGEDLSVLSTPGGAYVLITGYDFAGP